MRNKYKVTMDQLASLCKRRGFIFQSSEIYEGINGFWDYGPLGCELKRNIREAWWKDIVQLREDVVGLESSIIMHPKVWQASGHAASFADPMVDCRACHKRFRADMLCEDQNLKLVKTEKGVALPAGTTCPACGAKDFTRPRSFNLMFKTFVGPVEEDSSVAYLRPETAQGIFTQFNNVLEVSRRKVPFGIAQIGKAFRNEINPRNFTFRSREFEQMELEYFIKPGTDQEWHEYWVNERLQWYYQIGFPQESLSKYDYQPDELAHYAKACVDVLYDFPFGRQELEGIATRGAFDLTQHQTFSGKSMEYFDPDTKEKFVPHVVEPSAGVDRIALALLCEAYREEWVPAGDTTGELQEAEPGQPVPQGYELRTVLRFSPLIAPVKVAVFPLLKNKPELVAKAREVFALMQKRWPAFWDQTGAIGRRYRRQDEIGTPFGITIDFQTLEDNTVTLRERDSMQQIRLKVEGLKEYLEEKIK
jgi:glycyl-tRNA synthetase